MKHRNIIISAAAVAVALSVALIAPVGASAIQISGTVKVTGSLVPSHTVNVSLYEDDGAGGWMWSPYFAETSPVDGTFTIDTGAAAPTGGYKVVFDDQPYNWYVETAYPSFPVVDGDVSDGTSITTDRSDINVTLPVLADAFTGKVADAKTGLGIGDITVTAYELIDGTWYSTLFSSITDVNGVYHIKGLPAGSYRLRYEDYNGGYQPYETPATSPETAPKSLALVQLSHLVTVETVRPTSGNAWTQSVEVAKRQYQDPTTLLPDYSDVKDIVIASGDARAQADPLAAAGLCWAYQVTDEASFNLYMNAPLLLVSSAKATDASVLAFIRDVAKANPDQAVTIHIVGGPGSVPDTRFTEIKNYVVAAGAPAPVADRIASVGDRFTLARDIALRMKSQAAKPGMPGLPGFVLVANGGDPAKFFDPLALSPIAASMGAPILLVNATTVPSATYSAISSVAPQKIYVGGGAGTVSDGVLALLNPKAPSGSYRIWGKDRYLNAIAIADYAIGQQWLYGDGSVGVASTITDAQLAGVLAGNEAAPLLVNAPTSLNTNTSAWLHANRGALNRVYVVGSTTSISATTVNAIKATVAN